jgi:hypothetical protein
MANVISLNKTDHPTLTQLLVNTPTGLFDFIAQQSGGTVTVTDPAKKAAIKAIKHPVTGLPFITET